MYIQKYISKHRQVSCVTTYIWEMIRKRTTIKLVVELNFGFTCAFMYRPIIILEYLKALHH